MTKKITWIEIKEKIEAEYKENNIPLDTPVSFIQLDEDCINNVDFIRVLISKRTGDIGICND